MTHTKASVQAEFLELFGFPSEPETLTGVVMKAVWVTLINERLEKYSIIERIKNEIIADMSTCAADYTEAEEYAGKIIRQATKKNDG